MSRPTTTQLPLVISVGDPAGVGPIVAAEAAAGLAARLPVWLFGDARWLVDLLVAQGVERGTIDVAQALSGQPQPRHGMGVVDCGVWTEAMVGARAPTAEGGRAQLMALEAAHAAVVAGQARALVTGPVSKEAISMLGPRFAGQTEHLARREGQAEDAVSMLFLGPRLAVGLVTTHLPLASVPAAITRPRVVRTLVHLAEALLARGASRAVPRVVVAGVNPHAGEHGLFGDEEQVTIAPAIEEARQVAPYRTGRAELVGIVGAETAFRLAAEGRFAGVVAMYHDQATIASKLVDFGEAVNVTWGLSHVRTSVDHGVAYDAVTRGEVDARGMRAAILLADQLTGGGAASGAASDHRDT